MELYLTQSRGQKSPKGPGKGGRAIEQAAAIQHLMSAVKHGQINDDPPKNPTFKQTQEQSAHDKACKAFGKAHEGAHDTPGGNQRWQVDTCPRFLEDQVAGDIDKDVWDIEYEQGHVERGSCVDRKVLGEARDLRIADV